MTASAPWPGDTRILQIDDLRLDLDTRRIEGADGHELPQRVFDLLLLLMAEPHRLHTRTELIERLWPGLVVEDANLSQSVWLLRKALGESRKHWVRTVSKGGYMFEPPASLQWFAEPPAQVPDEPVTAPPLSSPDDLPAQAASPVPQTRRSRPPPWQRWGVVVGVCAALAIMIAIAAVAAWQRRDPQPLPPPTQAVSVALMRVQDAGATEHWPAWLLYEWLKWKLDSLPEVTLLTEADLAAGTGTPRQVVFLSSSEAPEAAGKIVVMARFQDTGGEQRFVMQGTPAQMPAMVDALSQSVIQRLLPKRDDEWPTLQLGAAAARRYADAAQAYERRDWVAAAEIGREVVQLAPRFGLMRLQLAVAQSRMGQFSAAIEQMDAALDLLQPAPPETRALLQAQRLAMDPQRYRQAADAYAVLAERYPDKADYAIEYANLLVRAGKPMQALEILQAHRGKPQSIGTRIAVLLGLAQAYQNLGDPERLRENAQAAERLARNAGEGWNRELAHALVLQAGADMQQGERTRSARLLEEAAAIWEQAGNKTGALYAQFLAQMAAAPGQAKDAKLATLLASANAAGYRGLEINILIHLASAAEDAGNLSEYRRRLEQAAAIAQASGDIQAQHNLLIRLLNQRLLEMRMDDAQHLLERLQSLSLEGEDAVVVGAADAAMDSLRGRHARGMRKLDRAARHLPAPSELRLYLACIRVELALAQGDLQRARKDVQGCARGTAPASQASLLTSRAAIALYSGDRDEARSQLQHARARLESMGNGSDRWMYAIDVARLLTRAGDAAGSDELLMPLLAELQPTGYDLLVALTETGLAENCAARGDWACMRTHAAAARQGLPDGLWYISSRLDLLDGAAALAAGDRERAAAIGQQLVAEASRLGDAIIQLQAYQLLPSGSPDDRSAARELLVARTGMRGATLDWLQLDGAAALESR